MHISSDKFNIFGKTAEINCPKCNDRQSMTVLKSTSALGALGIPVYEYQVELFTVCPSCGSVFAVEKQLSEKLGRGKAEQPLQLPEDSLSYMTCINPQAYK